MFVALVALLGLAVGVALALLAEIVPDSSGGGHSVRRCPSCEQPLHLAALSPLKMQSSRCGDCGHPVSAARLPTVIATAVIFGLAASIVGARWQLVPILVFASSLIALSVVDIIRYRLPDRIIFPSLALSVALIALLSFGSGDGDHVLRGLLTALAYSGILLVFNIISPAGLAFGDVKLALLLGLFLGWSADSGLDAFRMVTWAMLGGMILGVLSGLLVGVGRRVIGPDFLPDPDFPPPEDGSVEPLLKTAFPFGPALAISAFALVVFSERFLAGTGILA